ncbi:unnamed protein product [Oppiella nova]|uniref:Uncharacterized protein n=1 Tax=Oppiella nova TaxID=334625 RepID=A0A7R9LEF3_9ACAR|nr:unnamed protein product [Oppiella nova]CAG2162304.1 unnamed protein product [Oppiella nova]
MKIDSFHQIQLGSVYRGLTPIDDNEVLNLYNGNYVPQKLIRSKAGGEQLPMKQLNDLFSVPEICLLSNVTEYFIKNNICMVGLYEKLLCVHDCLLHESVTQVLRQVS